MSRYSLQLMLVDKHLGGHDMAMAIDLDDETCGFVDVQRAKEEIELGVGGFDTAVTMLRRKQFRKELFTEAARRLGPLLAERMEDAEGWHDAGRIEPAREALGMEPSRNPSRQS